MSCLYGQKKRTVDQGQVSWVVESGRKKTKGQVSWNVSESLPRLLRTVAQGQTSKLCLIGPSPVS